MTLRKARLQSSKARSARSTRGRGKVTDGLLLTKHLSSVSVERTVSAPTFTLHWPTPTRFFSSPDDHMTRAQNPHRGVGRRTKATRKREIRVLFQSGREREHIHRLAFCLGMRFCPLVPFHSTGSRARKPVKRCVVLGPTNSASLVQRAPLLSLYRFWARGGGPVIPNSPLLIFPPGPLCYYSARFLSEFTIVRTNKDTNHRLFNEVHVAPRDSDFFRPPFVILFFQSGRK